MKTDNNALQGFALKPLVLAMLVSASLMSTAWAGSTPTTVAVSGAVPVLVAPSTGSTPHTVDFSGTHARPEVLSTGDTVVMTYRHDDSDGDEDDSLSSVVWSYTPVGGGADITITPTGNTPATGSTPGTSTIVIPAGALGAAAIKVEIWEQSKTGLPRKGQQAIIVLDTSKGTQAGGGGGTPTPPGPIVLGNTTDGVAGGIFLASDNPGAGSGVMDYSRTTGNSPKVGETYLFRAWQDANGNGVWDADEQEVTAQLRRITWKLDGTNTAAAGDSAPATLSNHAITGATTDRYTVPVNSASSSGAAPGDQGFGLKVEFD
ncbi:SinI family autotransporter-associated protein [Serratia fonticola]|uniref:SinI family autotransporter-associated protein n=1 Tax=Serratia fonticola TaxID=47917 RepID=UPI0009395620|nr:SinI family autotransporter-associated protein [Serratia fonticola]OKP23812.1 ornithine carbamoyltransferase [Serratia fonticola]